MTHLKLLIFVLLFIQINGRENKLLLTVYYESKCPDSKSFILRQLQPTYNVLHPYIRLKMIPFGKAQSINYGDDGFECQHGPSECMGNIVQDCVLHHMRERSDAKLLAYVACEMKSEAAARGDFYCVERAGLPTSTIGRCAMSGQGVALQMESEYYTNLLRPKFIPTITINGVFDQQIQNDSQRDLLGTLCSILTEAPPCARYHNKVAMNHLLYSNGPTYYLNSGYLTK